MSITNNLNIWGKNSDVFSNVVESSLLSNQYGKLYFSSSNNLKSPAFNTILAEVSLVTNALIEYISYTLPNETATIEVNGTESVTTTIDNIKTLLVKSISSRNADTATQFASAKTYKLTGAITGESSSTGGFTINTTLSDSAVTPRKLDDVIDTTRTGEVVSTSTSTHRGITVSLTQTDEGFYINVNNEITMSATIYRHAIYIRGYQSQYSIDLMFEIFSTVSSAYTSIDDVAEALMPQTLQTGITILASGCMMDTTSNLYIPIVSVKGNEVSQGEYELIIKCGGSTQTTSSLLTSVTFTDNVSKLIVEDN